MSKVYANYGGEPILLLKPVFFKYELWHSNTAKYKGLKSNEIRELVYEKYKQLKEEYLKNNPHVINTK